MSGSTAIIVGVTAAILLLLVSGKRSERRHEEWRREHGLPKPFKRRSRFRLWWDYTRPWWLRWL